MKNIKVLLLICVLVFTFSSCKKQVDVIIPIENKNMEDSWYIKNWEIIYYQPTNWSYQKQLEEVDWETFVVLAKHLYAKDKNNVYIGAKKLEGADSNSFEALFYKDGLVSGYAKDKNHVYYNGEKMTFWSSGIKADNSSFQALREFYAKDENRIYYMWTILRWGYDVETFKVLGNDFTSDKDSIYWWGLILEWVDSESFQILEYWYSKDKNNIYYHNDKIFDKIDSNTFKILDENYIIDKNNAYYYNSLNINEPIIILDSVDLKTFKILWWEGYAKDKNHVYFDGNRINNANSDTFETLKVLGYSKDKNNYYYHGIILNNIDYNTFEVFNRTTAKDKNHVYYSNDPELDYNIWKPVLAEADPETFEMITKIIYKDKNNLYFGDELIEWVDVNTFEILKNDFHKYMYKDKNNIYFIPLQLGAEFTKIEDADIESFIVLNTSYAKDKNNCFYLEEFKWTVWSKTEMSICDKYSRLILKN